MPTSTEMWHAAAGAPISYTTVSATRTAVDPTARWRDHHYRATEVDVFEAHDEFRRLYVAGLTVRCDDLRPALVRRYGHATHRPAP